MYKGGLSFAKISILSSKNTIKLLEYIHNSLCLEIDSLIHFHAIKANI